MRFIILVLSLFLSSQVVGQTVVKNTELGFSHEIPAYSNEGFGLISHYYFPVNDRFQPNLNIMRQDWRGEAEAYLALSLQQFKSIGYKTLSSSVNGDAVIMSYTGLSNGLELRWFSKAIVTDKATYLITSTAKQSQWELFGDELEANVNSFKLDE